MKKIENLWKFQNFIVIFDYLRVNDRLLKGPNCYSFNNSKIL